MIIFFGIICALGPRTLRDCIRKFPIDEDVRMSFSKDTTFTNVKHVDDDEGEDRLTLGLEPDSPVRHRGPGFLVFDELTSSTGSLPYSSESSKSSASEQKYASEPGPTRSKFPLFPPRIPSASNRK